MNPDYYSNCRKMDYGYDMLLGLMALEQISRPRRRRLGAWTPKKHRNRKGKRYYRDGQY